MLEGLEVIQVSQKGRQAYKDSEGSVYLDCTKCGVITLESEFKKSKSGFLGKNPSCKKCVKAYIEENKTSIAEYRREYNRKYYENNKEKWVEHRREYMKKYRELHRERFREYYKKNKKRKLEYQCKYRENNKERMNEYQRSYRKNNPEKRKVGVQRRRARKLALPDTLTAEQANLLGTSCVLTGQENVHLDHVIPLSIGHGGTTYENMISLSAELNQSKNASNVFEWAEQNHERFGFTMDRFNEVITEVASRNDMTLDEYRQYVYWCFKYPREVCPENEILCK